jgi:Domain of unknown function (DUF4157)
MRLHDPSLQKPKDLPPHALEVDSKPAGQTQVPPHPTAGNQAVQRMLDGAREQSGPDARHPDGSESSHLIHAAAQAGTRGSGQPLPHLSAIQSSFGSDHDLSPVRAHIGGSAAEAAQSMRATAFATGNRVAFREPPSLKLAAHEAAHVVQQRAGVDLSDGVGAPNDPYEKQADAIAARVAAGQSATDLLPSPAARHGLSKVQKQHSDDAMDAGGPPLTTASSDAGAPSGTSVLDRVRAALTRANPDPEGAGVGDFPEAFGILNGLAMFDMLSTLDALQRTGDVEVLNAHIAEAGAVGVSRIRTAISTVRLAHAGPGTTVGDVVELVRGLQNLPADQQTDILNYVMQVKAVGIDRESLVALVTAIPATNERPTTLPGPMSSASTPPASFATAAPAAAALGGGGGSSGGGPPATTSITPATGGGGAGGTPPRRPQPPHLRIGNLAHRLIAAYYRTAHPGDVVFTNWYGMRRLIREIGDLRGITYNVPANTNDRDWNTQPDITNLSRPHLYEIKPTALAAQAAAEAAFYIGIFARAGVVMPPGPAGEPGTVGIVPIPPVGFFAFDSPAPGIILYGLRVRLNQQALRQSQTGMSTAETVGVVILAVGLVAAAVLLTIFLPPVGVAVDEALIEGATIVGTGEAALGTEAVVGTGVVAGGETIATTATAATELSGEALELKTLLDLELAGQAANDNALIDVVLDEAVGF